MRIRPELEPLVVPMNRLEPHPENARKGAVGDIVASLKRFGQLRPILCRPLDGDRLQIVAGHHTFYAAQKLKAKGVAVVAPALTDDEADAYLAADNRLAELGGYDDDLLARHLEGLAERGLLEGTGYEPTDVSDLLALMHAPELDELAAAAGGDSKPSDFWPVLRFKVSPRVLGRFKRLTGSEATDDPEALVALLDLAEGKTRRNGS